MEPTDATGSQALVERFCVDCKHLKKSMLPAALRYCQAPHLPVSLIHGRREFPAVIARGYPALCGWKGRFWEKR